MSCPNFMPMKYDMPMVCGKTYGQYAALFKRESGEDMTETDYWNEVESDCYAAMCLADNFTENLMFHKITVIDGHYESFQFYVEELHSGEFDLDKNSEVCINNDDAHYYFDMCQSAVLRKATAEKRKIERWLYSLKKHGYNLVGCTNVFSNGEAEYCIL